MSLTLQLRCRCALCSAKLEAAAGYTFSDILDVSECVLTTIEQRGNDHMDALKRVLMICPLLSGPKSLLFWTTKEFGNGQEAQAGGDHR
jgi:hypothetical protein